MQIVKVGPKGQISIPAGILRKLGIQKDTTMLAEITEDGGILLRLAVVHPIEIYSDARIREFEEEDRMSAAERKALARRKR